MPYYPTLAEDIKRAREILDRGKPDIEPLAEELGQLPADYAAMLRERIGGSIVGGDVYAAYMLLKSFVEVIEAIDVKVCELALRHRRRAEEPDDDPEQRAHLRSGVPEHPRRHIAGCTCVIVNGEYRSTEIAGCPIHQQRTLKDGTPLASITCPRCGRTSYHPKDISERYCGNCHQFHDEMGRT